jgi:hypothetical protein
MMLTDPKQQMARAAVLPPSAKSEVCLWHIAAVLRSSQHGSLWEIFRQGQLRPFAKDQMSASVSSGRSLGNDSMIARWHRAASAYRESRQASPLRYPNACEGEAAPRNPS